MEAIDHNAIDRPSSRFINRELSWLEFNQRVLVLAEDEAQPLLERVRFLAIFAKNLDEFFQVRVAGLRTQAESGIEVRSPDGRSPTEQLHEIRAKVIDLCGLAQDLLHKVLMPLLAEEQIELLSWGELEDSDRLHLSELFDRRIFPVLTPLAVDPAHPFPYVSNLSLNLAVLVADPNGGRSRFARVKVPPNLPRFLRLPGGDRLIPIEEVIAAHIDRLFVGVDAQSHCGFRVTRSAELDLQEDGADDLLRAIESSLQRRRRASDPVRLEISHDPPKAVVELLAQEFGLDDDELYESRTLLALGGLWEICDLERPELKLEPWVPRPPIDIVDEREPGGQVDFFALLQRRDVFVHHPYESFDLSVEAFLAQAADDPAVLAIKHTIYRTSGPEASIGRLLMRAAAAGKQVVALVEIKARFDERANIDWARALERAGVHVVYGLVGLKTHAKLALVVRNEEGGLRRYCHIGTGNYNPVTARLYEDMGLFSASEELGTELSELFNHLTGCGEQAAFRKLLVAPDHLRGEIVRRIEAESQARDGHIVIKVNSLSDPRIIDALYEASQAGTQVDLIVRGICCLRPGVPGLSENIRVTSILGRFLEHSRILRFGSEARGYEYFFGSADMMTRNLDRRVEVMVPVDAEAVKERVQEVLDLAMNDRGGAWSLGPDGEWTRWTDASALRLQDELQQRTHARGARWPELPTPTVFREENGFEAITEPTSAHALEPSTRQEGAERCGVLDLGSTSFHLLVADVWPDGRLEPVVRERHMLRLGSTIVSRGHIDNEAIERATATAHALRELAESAGATRLIAVATAALRDADNGGEVASALEASVELPVNVLSGEEEARAIFRAIAARGGLGDTRLLALDLGGGSLELAVGRGDEISLETTLPLGVVRLHGRFVASDPVERAEQRAITEAVLAQLTPISEELRAFAPERAVIAGGTAKALLAVAEGAGMAVRMPGRTFARLAHGQVQSLCGLLVHTRQADRLTMPGMKRRRADLLPAGALIVEALMSQLGLDVIEVSDWGLREGLLLGVAEGLAGQTALPFGPE